MLSHTWKWTVLLMAAAVVILIGCSRDEETSEPAVTDEQALAQLMTDDAEIENLDAWAGDDASGGGGLDETITPIGWGRIGARRNASVRVEIRGDTLATITRTVHFNGQLRIVTDTTGGLRTFIEKPMFNTIVRKAHAVRIGNGPRPRLNWRIREITPDMLTSSDPNPHSIRIQRMQMFRNDGGTLTSLMDITDPLATYLTRAALPIVRPDDEIVIWAAVDTANVVHGVLHPRVFTDGLHPRLALHDDGVYPDLTADDGIYSGSYFTRARTGVFLAAVDFLDHETLYDSAAPYDAASWACPYRVMPSE
jgi:hypothetical protein